MRARPREGVLLVTNDRVTLRRLINAPSYAALWSYSLARTQPLVWRFLNRSGRAMLERHRPSLDGYQQALVDGLSTDGVAVTHFDDLFSDQQELAGLVTLVERLKRKTTRGVKKPFLEYIWGGYGEDVTIDFENPFVMMSLDTRALSVINSYMQVCSKLVHFNLSSTNPVRGGDPPVLSQRWHRDPGMKRLVKMFLYLSDVDEESGPFTYVLGSHAGGRLGRLFPQKQFGRRGMYPPSGAVERSVAESGIRVCTGKSGTVILCDTTGLHRGGRSLTRSRTMFTAVYVDEAGVIETMLQRSAGGPDQGSAGTRCILSPVTP